ncbi:metallophosphoesterase [bacterium]|nr:metallophosphoesterase [bacterium]
MMSDESAIRIDKSLGRSDRRQFMASLAALTAVGPAICLRADESTVLYPELSNVPNAFRMVLIADTQVGPTDARGVVPATSNRKMSQIVDEINLMAPLPAFVVFDGDQVENVEKRKVDNFIDRAKPLKPLSILIHGNHDGVYPYAEFQAMQKEMNGTEGIYFSWDVGSWHFATVPTNIPHDDYARDVLDWLESDLLAHRDRPTMLFLHYHMMPQGLSQLEWYTYERSFRLRCYDLFEKVGNVRYVIGGHVHNGIQTSLKTSWSYRGTNYMVAPTCTASRNFGEDFPPFVGGLAQNDEDAGGGYYLTLDFNGPEVQIRGRLVGVHEDYAFPPHFKEYVDQDPLWLGDISLLPIHASIQNGTFDDKRNGWQTPFRYRADNEPGFVADPQTPEGSTASAIYLACREKGQHWARDEEVEIYQRLQVPPPDRTNLSFRFMPAGITKSGGGYVRLSLFRQRSLVMTILIDWLEGKKDRNTRMGINSLYTATGKRGIPDSFIQLGKLRQAMFWTLDAPAEHWHQVDIDLPRAINASLERKDAWESLAVDEMLLSAGVWCLEDRGSRSAVWFDDFAWTSSPQSPIQLDGQPLPMDERVFVTNFGRETWQGRQQEKAKRRKGISYQVNDSSRMPS